MKIKAFYRNDNDHIIEFADGRKIKVSMEKLSKADLRTIELVDVFTGPIDAKVVEIDGNLKNWTKNKLNSIEDKLDRIIEKVGA